MDRIITLCTDFGQRDGYVAAMKGVILSIAPHTTLVDITHQIAPQSLREGAFVLGTACPFFPPETIHLVVIDPGVGGTRRAIAVQTERYYFVAPDNGILTYVLQNERILNAVSLTKPRYWRARHISNTFHGRDIFAPAAAHLARGVALNELGDPIQDIVQLPLPHPQREKDGTILGEVLHIDHFGNIITNIPAEMLTSSSNWSIQIGERSIDTLSPTYATVAPGQLLALIGSHGNLEIAMREGNAAQKLRVSPGTHVRVLPRH